MLYQEWSRSACYVLQVMLAKNLDIQTGLVNGARGVVVHFKNDAAGKYTECLIQF